VLGLVLAKPLGWQGLALPGPQRVMMMDSFLHVESDLLIARETLEPTLDLLYH
jgi:hypothetical protein